MDDDLLESGSANFHQDVYNPLLQVKMRKMCCTVLYTAIVILSLSAF